MGDLTERDLAILSFEQRRWLHAGAKEQSITDEFGMTPTLYYAHLNRLLDNPAAYVAEPMLVKRLRALRQTRRARRAG